MLRETKRRLLSLTPASWTELKEELGISGPALLEHLNDLEGLGLVTKESGNYELTGDGRAALEEEGVVELSRGSMAAAESLAGEKDVGVRNVVERVLRARGCAADLEEGRSALELAAAGSLPPRDALETRGPDPAAREYLSFLADLYVGSIRNFLGKAGAELRFEELRAAWLTTTPVAWEEVDEREEGLVFDYPGAWGEFGSGLSPGLERKMEERDLAERRVFGRLRLFSLPTLERTRYLRNNPERIVDPPLKKSEEIPDPSSRLPSES